MGNLKFAKEKEFSKKNSKFWKVLIVDDEPAVHTMTKAVLSDFKLDGRKLQFISAFNGEEAIKLLQNTNNITVVLLDVVMESNDAGLIVAQRIREELNNQLVRIVLRTGQPGSAPEEEVIIKYRINDYKEKTELTSKKLFTTMVAAIRSYQDLTTINNNKKGLEKIIEASKSINEERSMIMFAQGVLTQLISILNLNNDSLIINAKNALSIERVHDHFEILAGTGEFEDKDGFGDIDEHIKELILDSIENEVTHFYKDCYIGFFKFNEEVSYLIYISGCQDINSLDKKLTEIFSSNIAVAFNNISLNNEILETQKEIIESLGEVVEKRSKEASKHVHRVAEFSYELAKDYGLNEEDSNLLKMASPMHDIGKIGIKDEILLKPGVLTTEEFKIMKTHARIGYDILKNSKRDILKAAAIIAHEHHEKYDGNGYPRGLKEEEIHIFGRITAVADVFDALYHKRCYKGAWPLENIIELFDDQKNKHFDPKLVEIILKNIEKYTHIVKFD